MSKIKISRL